MDHFDFRDGVLYAEDTPLTAIADAVGTPVYVYSRATLARHARVFREALSILPRVHIAFAIKANPNLSVLRVMQREGLGADVVSGGEMARALAAGMPASDIVFSGVGKQAWEMIKGLEEGIGQFNLESEEEGVELAALAAERGLTANCALRVNPDVDARTHEKISTGKAENKFGVPIDLAAGIYARLAALPGLNMRGVAVHIGSQLNQLEPFEIAFAKVGALIAELRANGQTVTHADLGGGLGVPYKAGEVFPSPEEYAAMVARATEGWDVTLMFEPVPRRLAGVELLLMAGAEVGAVNPRTEQNAFLHACERGDVRVLQVLLALQHLRSPLTSSPAPALAPAPSSSSSAAATAVRRGLGRGEIVYACQPQYQSGRGTAGGRGEGAVHIAAKALYYHILLFLLCHPHPPPVPYTPYTPSPSSTPPLSPTPSPLTTSYLLDAQGNTCYHLLAQALLPTIPSVSTEVVSGAGAGAGVEECHVKGWRGLLAWEAMQWRHYRHHLTTSNYQHMMYRHPPLLTRNYDGKLPLDYWIPHLSPPRSPLPSPLLAQLVKEYLLFLLHIYGTPTTPSDGDGTNTAAGGKGKGKSRGEKGERGTGSVSEALLTAQQSLLLRNLIAQLEGEGEGGNNAGNTGTALLPATLSQVLLTIFPYRPTPSTAAAAVTADTETVDLGTEEEKRAWDAAEYAFALTPLSLKSFAHTTDNGLVPDPIPDPAPTTTTSVTA